MTREEAIAELTIHLKHWKRLKEEHIASKDESERTIKALDMAIEALSAEHKHCWDCKHYEPKYNVCHAPEVVKQVTSKLNNPCDSLLKDDSAECKEQKSKLDLISRADAIEAVAQEWLSEASAESPYVNDDDIGEYRKLAEDLFADIPSADAVHGEWIMHIDDLFPCESTQECSVCHAEQPISISDDDYCPSCGARMENKE